MKNIFKKIFFSVLVTCLFISCSDFSNSDSSFVTNEKGRIIISTNLDSQSRSVLPTGITEQTQGLTWELVGTCEEKTYSERWNDTTSEDGSVTSTAYNNMKNDNDLLLDVGTWLFSLKVKNNNGYVLVGTTQVAINSGENTLSFVMNEATSDDLSDGETVASGSIEFTLNFPTGVINKGIATLTPLAGGNSFTQEFTADAASTNQFLSSITYTNENISAGYYILKIQLQQEGNATTPAVEYINTYSCLIRVAPGLSSIGKYTLTDLAQLYTITYECNQGIIENQLTTASYNAYTSFNLPTPTRQGYEFVGWYTDETYDTPASNDGTYKISRDTTLYAKWVEAVSGITHANNTLYISSYEGLKVFRDIVNGSLKSNITIPGDAANSGTSVPCNAGTPVTSYNAELQSNITIDEDWTPIGVYTNASSQVPYVGEFKGNNNTITFGANVSINSQAAGLFGAISDGCNISNLIIEGNIQSSSSSLYSGGIVGYATGGSVQNCVNKAKIQNAGSAGGIAGKTQSTSFNGCVNFGEINGTNYSAGIVGAAASNTSINLCVNIGNISSTTTACGISGDVPADITVQNCINLGTLSATNNIYGISSGSGDIKYNISAGKFEGTVQYSCYAVSSRVTDTNYYDNSIYSNLSIVNNVEGMATSEFSNWSPDELAWLAAEGRYPLPNISENVDAGIQAIPDEIWNEIYDAAAISVSDPMGGGSITYGGTDSTGVPIFYVYSAEGLATFRNIVNGTLLDDTLTSYTISADSSVPGIADYSITNQEAFTKISGVLKADIDLSGIEEWIPIGNADFPFSGSFDGQNKTISNLTIQNATTDNQGLFGVIDGTSNTDSSEIKNLVVNGSIKSSGCNVAGIVGKAIKTNFIGCVNNASVESTYNETYNVCVGGIAGYVTNVEAEYCYNSGNITANMSVGGIIGYEASSTISNPTFDYCVNTGTIKGTSYIGGIIGYANKALSLGFCANYGTIDQLSTSTSTSTIGCIIGSCSSTNKTQVTECLIVGSTTATNYFAVSQNANVTYSYYDKNILSSSKGFSSNGGGSELETSQLKTGIELDNFYYGDWNYENGRYPIPDLEGEISSDAWNLLVNTVSTL